LNASRVYNGDVSELLNKGNSTECGAVERYSAGLTTDRMGMEKNQDTEIDRCNGKGEGSGGLK